MTVQLPGGQATLRSSCALDAGHAAALRGLRPYVNAAARRIHSRSRARASAPARAGQVTLDGVIAADHVVDQHADRRARVPDGYAGGTAAAQDHGRERAEHGQRAHLPRARWRATTRCSTRSGPARTYAPVESLPATADHAIQRALDAARPSSPRRTPTPIAERWWWSTRTPTAPIPRQNPRGAYYENLIISEQGEAAGRRPGQPRRLGARLDHRRRRLRRRQPGGDRLVHPDRHADLGRQPDHLRRRGHLDLPAEHREQRLPDGVQPPAPRRRSTASTCAAATSRASPATST